MATFTEQLMAAKQRARLQGRPISQQETAGIAQGQAESAADRTTKAKSLELQEQSIANQQSQFAEQLAAQKLQYASSYALSERGQVASEKQFAAQLAAEKENLTTQLTAAKEQWTADYAIKEKALTEEITSNQRSYDQAVATLTEQIRQYNESSATQKAQFGAQMEQQIAESQQRAEEFEATIANQQQTFELQKASYVSELAAAGQEIPSSLAPEGWNTEKYLANNPDVATNAYWSSKPLLHWYTAGKAAGRSYL
jgi:hypothetical protein